MTKVSVIIPIYNVEKVLDQCLESVVKQTLSDIEIICINDGSSDNSLDILKKWAEKDLRVKIINQENHGLSYARNQGIKNASGKYLSFIDSDDWVDIDFLEKMYLTAEKYQADVAACSMMKHRLNGKINKFICFRKEKVASDNSKKFRILHIPERNHVVNKIYLRTLITSNQIYFPEGRYFEDTFWTPPVIYSSRLCVTVPNVYYHYRINKTSITSTTLGNSKKETDLKEGLDFIDNFVKNNKIKVKFRYKEKCDIRFFGIPIFQTQKNDDYKYIYILGIKIFSIKYTRR